MSFAPDVFGQHVVGSLRESAVFGAPDAVVRDHEDELTLDQAKRFEFKVDDADTAGAVLAVIASEVARALVSEVDQYLASHWTVVRNHSTGTVSRSADVIDRCLLPLGSALDQAGVTATGRYAIIPPALYFALRQDPRFTETLGPNGLVGAVDGLSVRMSNHCAAPSTGTYVVQAGVPDAVTFTERIDDIEVQRSAMSPDLVHGVARYGCHVAKPDHLACCLVTLT